MNQIGIEMKTIIRVVGVLKPVLLFHDMSVIRLFMLLNGIENTLGIRRPQISYVRVLYPILLLVVRVNTSI